MSGMLRSAGVLFSFFVMMMAPARAQIITTVAGNGTQGFSGDGGLATSAQVAYPYALTVDSAGNLYIADIASPNVRKITKASGIITTIAGTGTGGFSGDGGPATSAQLISTYGIAFDAAGNLYIVDNGNNRVRKISAATGIISTVAGTGTAGFSGDGGLATNAKLDGSYAIAIDATGTLYIADQNNHRIRKISSGTPAAVSGIDAGWVRTLSISPSPNNGSFTISANSGAGHSNERVKIEVFSPTGQRVYNNEITPATAQWSIPVRLAESVANGVYQLRISAGNNSAVRNIVIQK